MARLRLLPTCPHPFVIAQGGFSPFPGREAVGKGGFRKDITIIFFIRVWNLFGIGDLKLGFSPRKVFI